MVFFLSAVVNNADQKFACDIVYLDFRKAFDSVGHKELLFKLWLMGITGDLWFWFKSYYLISGRTHLTSFNNFCSSSRPVISGVPQGSVLGPLLFVIYNVNDLPTCIANTSIYLFADDTKILQRMDSSESQHTLQTAHISTWCNQWKLTLNHDNVQHSESHLPNPARTPQITLLMAINFNQ